MQPVFVIGYDPSKHGADAVALGAELGELSGALQIVASVLPWRRELMDVDRHDRLSASHTATVRLEVRDRLRAQEWDVRTLFGDSPAMALCELAEHESAQLIVLGRTERSRAERWLFGSTVESALAGAPCAVAVASAGYSDAGPKPIERVGVAFDGSAEAELALAYAIEVAEPLGARVSLCAVADIPQYSHGNAWETITRGECVTRDERRKRRMLERVVAWMPARTNATSRVVVGAAGPALAALSGEFDLMLAGSRGYGPLRRTVLGSATRCLLSEARCPVIVTPRGSSGEALMVRGGLREGGSMLGSGPGLGAD